MRPSQFSEKRRWIVAQIGAREHYAVPRAFDASGRLRAFYTDVWFSAPAWVARRSRRLRALAGRSDPRLPRDRVVSFSAATLFQTALAARRRADRAGSAFEGYVRAGRAFAQRVRWHLERQPLDPEADAFFGFFTGSLETLELMSERGVPSVVDQADAGRKHYDLVRREAEKWPGWQDVPDAVPDVYFERLDAEWRAASLVLVNSEWSKSALVEQGVPAGKLIVVPLAFEGSDAPPPPPRPRGPLTVLFVGHVVLGKGIQYLIEAARTLQARRVRFMVAGASGLRPGVLDAAPPNMTFLGPVTRDRVSALYREADAFVLPTISDGFALTQLEAMSHGVPVIATPNCGRVVDDGVDGLIVPAFESRGLAEAIARLDDDRPLRDAMAERALEKSKRFTLHDYADRVDAAVRAWAVGRAGP